MAAISPSSAQQPSNSPDSASNYSEAVDTAGKVKTHRNSSSLNGEAKSLQVPFERSVTPVLPDPNMFYMPAGYPPAAAYYYGGFNGSATEWDDYSRFTNHDGVEGAYGDMYHPYAYAPFSTYHSNGAPVPIGHDGQLYGPQHYQYPAFFQPPTPKAASKQSQIPTTKAVSTSAPTDQTPISVSAERLNPNGVAKSDSDEKSELATVRSGLQTNPSVSMNGSGSHKSVPGSVSSAASEDSRFNFDQMLSTLPQFDVPHRPVASAALSSKPTSAGRTSTRSHNSKSQPQVSGMHSSGPTFAVAPPSPAYVNSMYSSSPLYGHNGNPFGPGFGFGSNRYYGSRTIQRWGQYPDLKNFRGQGIGYYRYGNENREGLSELSKGPRNNNLKTLKGLGYNTSTDEKVENSLSVGKEDNSLIADKEKYSGTDFPGDYKDAMFFIIKSYSEDDIHKSIKYNVWASTPNGNKKLNAAFLEAQEKRNGCPVFLFFSVNTSGQFVGVASMVGPVDFDKTVNYWQQDKWIGCFPVKWHIIKDIPNSLLKQITLENNDNKPVTNSRDTQEVKLEQGLQMLKIFKEHAYRTSVLDDFEFYNNREKIMLEKRAKQQYKKVLDGRISDGDSLEKDKYLVNGKPRMQKPLESISILNNTTPKGCSIEQNQPNEIVAASIETLKAVADK